MIEFILNLLFFWGAVWLTSKYMAIKLQQNKEIVSDRINKIKETIHFVNVEQHGNIEYWFDAHDGKFIAQGGTGSELINHCKERFPQHSFFIISANTNKIYKISGPDWEPTITDIDLTKNSK